MDSRRDFLRRAATALPLIPLVGVERDPSTGKAYIASPPDYDRPRDDEHAELYKGYAIFWTGWKAGSTDESFRGQWLAWPHPRDRWPEYGEKAYIVTAVPYSHTGFYRKGDLFNHAIIWARVPPGHPGIVSFDSDPAIRALAIEAGKTQLLDFIDREGHR